jgi:hypothetical protein
MVYDSLRSVGGALFGGGKPVHGFPLTFWMLGGCEQGLHVAKEIYGMT